MHRSKFVSVNTVMRSPRVLWIFEYGLGYDNASSSFESASSRVGFMFSVTLPARFHSFNMQQPEHPSHFPSHARTLGPSYVSWIEEVGPGSGLMHPMLCVLCCLSQSWR